MDDLKTVISNLCQSDYLAEWILKLKDNEILFSPIRNIKPCIKVDNNSVRSAYWDGLTLLRSYCSRGFDNDEVDSFIIVVLNESINIYKNDTEIDPYKRLDSSSAILYTLLDIILSKPVFINNIDFPFFSKTFLNSATSWSFSLVYGLFQAKNVLLEADPKKVFDVYKTIAENKNRKDDYEKYLIVEELILKNPYDYYNYSKEYLLNECAKKQYFDLGAFYEYGNSYLHDDDIYCFSWLKISSKGIDETLLRTDIKRFIDSGNELLNKVGLCLININFEKVETIFYDNLELFFSKEGFYSDLRCIFNVQGVRIFKQEKQNLLVGALKSANFGLTDGRMLLALKNHIAGIFVSHGVEVQYIDEKPSDLEYALNFNKRVYLINSHREEDVKSIKDSIWNKDIEEALVVYHNILNRSYYFSDIVFNAFREYLLNFYPDTFVDYLGRFDNRFVTSLIYHFANDNDYESNKLTVIVSKLIELIKCNDEFLQCISALLYATQKLSKDIKFEELKSIVYSIDYKWLTINEYEETKDIITICINENLYTYFELLGYISQINHDVDYLRKVIDYHISNNDCSKLKSILAFIYPRIMSASKAYALSMVDYIFENVVDKKNVSYPMFAISRGLNEEVFDSVSCRDDLFAFLSEDVEQGDDRIGLSTLAQWVFRFYIFSGKYVNLVNIQFAKKQFHIILDCIRDVNYWLESKSLESNQLERYKNYLSILFTITQNAFSKQFEIDYLIRAVAGTIVLSDDFDDVAWDVLLSLFKWFRDFFPDDCVELVEKYKDSREKEVTQLLDMYFNSYEPYLTYEQTLVDVYNKIAIDETYKRKAKKWKVSLLEKNTGLKDKLI